MRRLLRGSLVGLALAACGGDPFVAGSRAADGGENDSSMSNDSEVSNDSGTNDSGSHDSGASDSGMVNDSGASDSGTPSEGGACSSCSANQTCVSGVCTGVCGPGQTHPMPCGNCGTNTQTCGPDGQWQSGACVGQGACAPTATQSCNTYGSQTCSATCMWEGCSCPMAPVCTPGMIGCVSTSEEANCTLCGQWYQLTPCPTGHTCSNGQCS